MKLINFARRSAAAAAIVLSGSLALTACSQAESTNATASDSSTTSTSSSKATSQGLVLTDVKGRTVELEKQPERIILGEGRGVFATSLLNKDNPLEHVVAWGTDLKNSAPSFYERFVAAVPQSQELPTIGNLAKGDVTVENLLSFEPDLLVMTADHYDGAKTTGLLDKLDAAGIPYVVTDFRQHPMTNTTKSVELLGEVFGRQQQAAKFNAQWTESIEGVKSKVATISDRPTTFLWRAAGLKDCCGTFGKANIGEMITLAGGDNIADHLLSTESGDVTAELLITEQPSHVIATGGSWAPDKDKPAAIPHANLGYNTDAADAQATLQGLLATPGLAELQAPQEDHFYAVWHQFYDSPLNFIAVEQIAKWLHPTEFADLDPEADWVQVHEDYLPFPATGTFFVADQQ